MNIELKKKIVESRKSQVEIAKELGIHATRLSEIVRGWKDPENDLKKKIANLLGCKINEIF